MTGDNVLATPKRSLQKLVDQTPPERNRVVDAMRALSITVVVIWHWSLSITHRDETGALVNPNPIDQVPGAWAATWVLQVMPVFFVVGGYANLAAWTSLTSETGDGRAGVEFLRRRARRLLVPVLVFVAVWALIDLLGHWLRADHRSVLDMYAIVFNPLWFVGAYLVIALVAPLTAAAHRRRPAITLVVLVIAVAAVDVTRFNLGIDAIGWLNFVLAWVLAHHLGYLWHDGWFGEGWSWRGAAAALAGLAGLAVLTSLGVYPRSLVATDETDISHLSPPTALIPVAALFQLGLILLCRPALERFLQRRRPWAGVVAVNAVIMTIFLWHMTALLISIFVFEAAGGTLGDDATLSWWLARPLWILGPAIVLVPLVALFSLFEVGSGD
jgi:fucose 4-O-acetylase-like acetyltransferase